MNTVTIPTTLVTQGLLFLAVLFALTFVWGCWALGRAEYFRGQWDIARSMIPSHRAAKHRTEPVRGNLFDHPDPPTVALPKVRVTPLFQDRWTTPDPQPLWATAELPIIGRVEPLPVEYPECAV